MEYEFKVKDINTNRSAKVRMSFQCLCVRFKGYQQLKVTNPEPVLQTEHRKYNNFSLFSFISELTTKRLRYRSQITVTYDTLKVKFVKNYILTTTKIKLSSLGSVMFVAHHRRGSEKRRLLYLKQYIGVAAPAPTPTLGDHLPEDFHVHSGVRQGQVLAPWRSELLQRASSSTVL